MTDSFFRCSVSSSSRQRLSLSRLLKTRLVAFEVGVDPGHSRRAPRSGYMGRGPGRLQEELITPKWQLQIPRTSLRAEDEPRWSLPSSGSPHSNSANSSGKQVAEYSEERRVAHRERVDLPNWVLTAGLQQLVGVKTHYEPPDIQQEILGAGDAD